jgi:pilus assembly protein CpaB
MTTTARGGNPERANRLLLIGAVALAVAAAALVFFSLSNFGGSSDNTAFSGGTVNVVVASRDIKAGTKITNEMLDVATLPQAGTADGAITDKTSLDGLTLRYPVGKGEQFTSAKVGQGDKGDGISFIVPAGKRAMAVQVSEGTSVGGQIVAGDHVDLMVVVDAREGDQSISRGITLLQNVEVLSVAQNAQKATTRLDANGKPIESDTAAGSIATRPDDTSADPKARTVTLAVAPEDAPLVAVAQSQGTVFLSLRAFGDDSAAETGARTLPTQ